jgi:O-antigen/teichoic acid export membrane protein
MIFTKGSKDGKTEHFSTEDLVNNLKGHAISNSLISVLSQIIQVVLNFGSIMVLARLLSPIDFGLVAMVTAIMGFLRVFSDGGLSIATVQREEISQPQISNLFWVNLSLGAIVTITLICGAPLLGWFYHEPRLILVTIILSFSFILTASTVQHTALLKRQMRFGIIALIQLISLVFSVGVGIIIGFGGYGYWAIVFMQISLPLVSFALTWAISRWRPDLPTRQSGTRKLLGFGANLSLSNFLWSVARGSDGLLIGKYWGSFSLGLYSRATALLMRPIDQMMIPIEAVFIPTLARVQNQPERYRRIFTNTYKSITLVFFSFTGLLLPLSKPITLTALGEKWEAAVPIFASFTLLGLYAPVCSVATWLLTSQGRGRDFLLSSIITSLVTVASFIIGLSFGPTGVALSYSISCLFINLPTVFFIAGRQGPVRVSTLWMSFVENIPVWVVVFAATGITLHFLDFYSPIKQLLICVPVGLMVGACFIFIYNPARKTIQNSYQAFSDWCTIRRQNQFSLNR